MNFIHSRIAFRATLFALMLGRWPVSDAHSAVSLEAKIDAIVQSIHESGKFNGSVLVTRADKVIYERSLGPIDPERPSSNRLDARYLAASVSKPFTAVLVLQLAEAGKLRVTDSLDAFFPNLASKPAGRVTLHQLLTHTSGLEEISAKFPTRRVTPRDLESAAVKPNPAFSYSSNGFVVLGLVIEKVTELSYEQVLTEKILIPAGMRDTGLARSGNPVAGLAPGFRLAGGKPTRAPLEFAIEAFDGAGSLYTTPRDLWRFDEALASNRILSRPMQELMLKPHVKERHGYGWFLSEQSGKYFPWHKGDFAGYTALLVWQIHRRETIALLSNLQDADVSELRTKILRVLKESPDP